MVRGAGMGQYREPGIEQARTAERRGNLLIWNLIVRSRIGHGRLDRRH